MTYGYAITLKRTNAFNHGIPQTRWRTWVTFVKMMPGAACNGAPIIPDPDRSSACSIDYLTWLKMIPETATLQNAFPENKTLTNDRLYQYIMQKYEMDDGPIDHW